MGGACALAEGGRWSSWSRSAGRRCQSFVSAGGDARREPADAVSHGLGAGNCVLPRTTRCDLWRGPFVYLLNATGCPIGRCF